jgi:two-component system chemotaxis response regulator CheY
MRVLIADDSKAMRALYRTVLERLGNPSSDIIEAKESREVMVALKNFPIDVVVFDWDLPGMDGLGLMGQLKELGLAAKVTVLLSVNRQQRALLPQVSRLGSFDSIDRPFTEEMFEKKFRSIAPAVAVKVAESSKGLRAAGLPVESDVSMPFLLMLPSAVIDDLLKVAQERRHEPGTVLLRSGQICDALHIVTGGEVEIQATGRPTRILGEGELYGEFSFMMSEPSMTTVRARKAVLTSSLSKARMSELLRKHPVLDKHLSSLMGRHKEVMTARATTIAGSDFKGTFDTMPFANVLQILNAGRKTGVLGIRHDELSGGIYLSNGEAIHAWTEVAQGEEAFYDLSSWGKARFAFNGMPRQVQQTLTKPLLTLLMEAMRRLEESGAGPVTPHPTTGLGPNPTPSPAAPQEPSDDVGLDALFPSQ